MPGPRRLDPQPQGQEDGKSRIASLLGSNLHPALVSLHNPTAQREAEAGAVPSTAGREKALKQMAEVARVDALSER